ncbi:unnamed protein product [Amoebophrya sp. A120]|nr:unnamed protein product [Amoebophrya sp. A120]|eukprot:GSA120T00001341001.1
MRVLILQHVVFISGILSSTVLGHLHTTTTKTRKNPILSGTVSSSSSSSSLLPPLPKGPGRGPDAQTFVKECTEHLKVVAGKIDHSYTDVMVRDALEHECALVHEQPLTHEHGFRTAAACYHFADELFKARMEFLEQNSPDGYITVCKNYWTATYGKPYKTKVHVKPPPTQLVWWWGIVIFVAGCFLVFLTNRNMKTRSDFARDFSRRSGRFEA